MIERYLTAVTGARVPAVNDVVGGRAEVRVQVEVLNIVGKVRRRKWRKCRLHPQVWPLAGKVRKRALFRRQVLAKPLAA